MKIRIKLIGLVLLTVIIPIIILYAINSSNTAASVVTSQTTALRINNSNTAAFVSDFLKNAVITSKSLASNTEIRQFAESVSLNGVSASKYEKYDIVTGVIKESVKRDDDLVDVFILDTGGNVITSYDSSILGKKHEMYEDFKEIASRSNGISNIFGPGGGIPSCYFYCCRDIYSAQNRKAGLAVTKVILKTPADLLEIKGYGGNAAVLIVDSDGKYVASSVSKPKSLEDVAEYRIIAKTIPDAIPFYKETGSKDTVKANADNYVVIGTAVPIGGWSVVTSFDIKAGKDLALKNSPGTGKAVPVILIVIAGAGVVFICWRFTKPLESILEIIARKNKGDINVRLELESNDEFGKISDEFNTMFDNIFESEQRYRTVVSMMDNVVYEVNLKTFKVYVSENFNKKFSFRAKDDSIAESFLYKMKIHKDDMKRFKEDLEKIVSSTGEKWEGEYRMKNYYGDFSWIKVRGRKFYDRSNAPSKIIGMLADIDREKKSTITLIQNACFDALTQLYNRPTFMRTLDEEMQMSYSRRSLDALMFIDLDDFKHFNDEYGHKCGDEVLKFVADTIKEVTYEKGFGGRLGGDEFVMCLTNLKLIGDAGKAAQDVISILNEGFISESTELHLNIHCSIGIAFFRENGSDSAELLEAADGAMYKIKKSGKSNFAYAGSDMLNKTMAVTDTNATFDNTF